MLLTVSVHDVICVTTCVRQANATCVPAAPGQSMSQCSLLYVAEFLVHLWIEWMKIFDSSEYTHIASWCTQCTNRTILSFTVLFTLTWYFVHHCPPVKKEDETLQANTFVTGQLTDSVQLPKNWTWYKNLSVIADRVTVVLLDGTQCHFLKAVGSRAYSEKHWRRRNVWWKRNICMSTHVNTVPYVSFLCGLIFLTPQKEWLPEPQNLDSNTQLSLNNSQAASSFYSQKCDAHSQT